MHLPKWFWVSMLAIFLCGLTIYLVPQPVGEGQAAPPAAPSSPPASPAIAPPLVSALPTPSAAAWRYPANTRIAGVEVGGMTEEDAQAALEREEAELLRPLSLAGPDSVHILKASDINLHMPIKDLLARARTGSPEGDSALSLPLAMEFDDGLLRALIGDLAARIAITPALGYDATASSFVFTPGLELDIDASITQIEDVLHGRTSERRVELVTSPTTATLRPSTEEIIAALAAREAEWGGVVGISLYNLDTDERIDYHADTVFSGVSVLKIPILLQSYISAATFTEEQRNAIKYMIEVSDNDSANELLAMIGDGDGLAGVEVMNATLENVLGLQYTRLAAPFESIPYLTEIVGLEIPQRGVEGAEPFTDADPYVRATPAEMSRIVLAIAQCANGAGPLLDMQETKLTARRCKEILQVLQKNQDTNKIVAGVPPGSFVAHKSGWIDDVRADSGYVRSPSGSQYVVSMWIWEDTDFIPTEVSDPLLADLSRILYTGQYPLVRGR